MKNDSTSAVSDVRFTASVDAPRCARLGCGKAPDDLVHVSEFTAPISNALPRIPNGSCPRFLSPEDAAALPWVDRLDMPHTTARTRPAAEVLTTYGYPLGTSVPQTRRSKSGGMVALFDGGFIHNPFRFVDEVSRHTPETPNAHVTWLEAHASVVSKSNGLAGGPALLADWVEALEVDKAMTAEREASAAAARKAAARAAFKAGLYENAAAVFPSRMVLDFIAPEDMAAWAPSTVYRPGHRLAHSGKEFVCWRGGTSGTVSTWADEEQPSGDYTDGSVTWRRLSALEAARQWVAQVAMPLVDRSAPLLLLVGGVGGGKSSAGVVAVMEAVLDGYGTEYGLSLHRVVFWNAPEVARRGLYGREVDASIREAVEADVLVIDDVGAEFSTTSGGAGEDAGNGPWLAMLDEVVNRRHGECRLTLITSNLEANTFAKRYGQRIVDRTRDGGRVVSVGTSSMRRKRPADAVARPSIAESGRVDTHPGYGSTGPITAVVRTGRDAI